MGDERRAFALSAKGWGTFEIPITVLFRSGEVQYLKHSLSFSVPPVEERYDIKADNTARQVRPGWWNWTIFVQAPDAVLAQVRCVEYKLHSTFPVPVQSVCERGKGPQAFPLSASGWGTFTVGIQVFFADGRRHELQHPLKFSTAAEDRKK